MLKSNFFFKTQIGLMMGILAPSVGLEAGMSLVGEAYLEGGVTRQRVAIEEEKVNCRFVFPGTPRWAVVDQGYIIKSESGGCVYELDIFLPIKNDPPLNAQELADRLDFQWKEPDFEVKSLQQAMLGVSQAWEIRSLKEEHEGERVGRCYATEGGIIYTLWIYGKGKPDYEVFDTFSLKLFVNRVY